MLLVTEAEMIEIFKKSSKSSKFISLKTRNVEPIIDKSRSNKRTLKEMYATDKVVKESVNNVQMNVIYQNAVNTRLEKAGEDPSFVYDILPYGSYVDDSRCLIEHNGEHYLRVYQTNLKSGKSSRYFKENGTEFSEEQIEILKRDFFKKKHEYIPSQGLSYEDSCKPTNYKFSNIKEVVMDGETYKII